MNAKRLLELADHMDKIGTSKPFDFSITVNSCGSVGCALWDLHLLHPRKFPTKLFRGQDGQFTGRISEVLDDKVCDWFDIDPHDCCDLFAPSVFLQRGHLGDDASRKQVARHIRKFVKRAKEEATK